MPGFDEGRARFATRVSPAWADPRVGLQIVTIDEQIGDVDQVVFAHPLPSSPRIINHQSRRHRSLLRCNLIDPFNVASIHGARGCVLLTVVINRANVAASVRHEDEAKRGSLESVDANFPIPRFI